MLSHCVPNQELVWLGWRSVDAVTLRAEGKVGFLVALPLLHPCLGVPALPSSTKEEPDYALRALMLLVYALFREAYGDTVEPGMAIMSVHHKASIAKEGGFTWFSRACSCDREAVTLIVADVAEDLVARALSHGLGPPLGKPRRSLASAYFGGVPPPAHRGQDHSNPDTTRRPHRGRHHRHQTCEQELDWEEACGVQRGHGDV